MFGLGKGKAKGFRQAAGDRIQSLSQQGMAGPEVEYADHKSPSVFVKVALKEDLGQAVPELSGLSASAASRPPAQQRQDQLPSALSLPPLPDAAPARERIFREDSPEPALPGLPSMPIRPRSFGGGEQLEPEDELEDEEIPGVGDLDEEPEGAPRMNRGVPPSPGLFESRLERIDGDFEELQERMERIEGRLRLLEQRIPTDFEKRETEALKQSSDTQNRALGEVTMRMEALEKVMKDSLTPMMQTMRSLSDTIKSLKGQRDGL